MQGAAHRPAADQLTRIERGPYPGAVAVGGAQRHRGQCPRQILRLHTAQVGDGGGRIGQWRTGEPLREDPRQRQVGPLDAHWTTGRICSDSTIASSVASTASRTVAATDSGVR